MRFGQFVTHRLGIRMPAAKLLMVQSRLVRRLRDLGLDNFHDYEAVLFDSPDSEEEQRQFFDLITTNKTEFFREPEHFDYLVSNILIHHRSDSFSAWSAGCSSGEEPYSLAMMLADHEYANTGFSFSLLGTDISERMLATATSAIYEEAKITPVPMQQRHRYLLRSRDRQARTVRIVPELRHRVSFARLNLMDEDYPVPHGLDLIFFRNVMIYFDRDTQIRVLRRMCRHLHPGGHLMISHTESVIGTDLPLLQVAPSVFRRQRD